MVGEVGEGEYAIVRTLDEANAFVSRSGKIFASQPGELQCGGARLCGRELEVGPWGHDDPRLGRIHRRLPIELSAGPLKYRRLVDFQPCLPIQLTLNNTHSILFMTDVRYGENRVEFILYYYLTFSILI